MSGTRRQNRNHVPIAEGLESRNLLNASAVSAPAAHIHAARAAASTVTVVKGIIHGTFTNGTPAQVTSTPTTLNFQGQGSANIVGSGTVTGSLTLSRQVSRRTSSDTYSNGQATLTSSSGFGSLSVTFSGTGKTNARGQFTATLRGTATDAALGASGPFVATMTGNASTGTFQTTITVRA